MAPQQPLNIVFITISWYEKKINQVNNGLKYMTQRMQKLLTAQKNNWV